VNLKIFSSSALLQPSANQYSMGAPAKATRSSLGSALASVSTQSASGLSHLKKDGRLAPHLKVQSSSLKAAGSKSLASLNPGTFISCLQTRHKVEAPGLRRPSGGKDSLRAVSTNWSRKLTREQKDQVNTCTAAYRQALQQAGQAGRVADWWSLLGDFTNAEQQQYRDQQSQHAQEAEQQHWPAAWQCIRNINPPLPEGYLLDLEWRHLEDER
jgi:hypothetical protein